MLGQGLSMVALQAARSEAQAAALVKAAEPAGGWVLGQGWDQNRWEGAAFPTARSLDEARPGTPIFLTRVDGHAAWVSSEALRRAGITAATVDPPGGRLLRDATGAPTGVLIDNAMTLVAGKLPAATPEVRQRWLKLALETCARLGLTQVHDAGMELESFKVLQHFDLLRALPVRVYAMADAQTAASAEEYLGLGRFKGDKLELRAAKLVLDGALGSRGAALLAPYSDEPGQRGLLLLSREELETRAGAFAAAGFQVAVHAIGDRANQLAIEVLSKLEAAHPGSRNRVEHAQVLSPDDVPRFAQGHLIASFQPTHATSDLPWAGERLGAGRLRFAYAWRSVLETGAAITFGSDFPIEDPNPLWGLYAARTRQTREGQPPGGWSPAQRLSGEEALQGFTTGGAFASFAEGERGQLREGFDADFVVLPIDPVADPPEALLHASVQVTVVGGIDVYRAPAP
jgi:predicted amidohydrolase YtcJ